MKRKFYTELAYLIGIVMLAFGTILITKADIGVSMIVAPAYVLHLKLSEIWPFFTFGVAEYCVQAVLLVLLFIVVRKFKISYFFSFVTAIFYGAVLDGFDMLLAFIVPQTLVFRIVLYAVGFLIATFSVSLLFHTYIAPEVYELFVKETSTKYNFSLSKFKTVFDCSCAAIGVIISFICFGFGKFEGLGIGTLVSALINGFLIGGFCKILERHFSFEDGLKLRKYFDK
ncbi:MAG: hypothetical protein E7315_06665 [Clostridiales bacterium]|nr:hypothetical protein [Clostridiales bacterium]